MERTKESISDNDQQDKSHTKIIKKEEEQKEREKVMCKEKSENVYLTQVPYPQTVPEQRVYPFDL